ncbi:diguanylate cyclase [Pseudomonas putida]|uniref:sensor domain-containing diguanylate cyclase n=1 Tax=Pseudomonas TaxID=286 RepID=UPI0011A90322|nr:MULTISPECIES: diguanylate cyclase [Pseudomonas]MBF8652790.1 diguanylate cyclase [Pseudomonas putida]MBF8657032.1 diguanylate cyclase [Pseudomonas putida]MEB8059014.1 diguanylate cyclase [Pseudomonas fulva]
MPTSPLRLASSRSHPELALVLGSCLAVLAIVAIVSYLLMRERESVEQSAVRSANNIVQLIESDILRNVELYDQALQGLIWAVGRKELPSVPGPLRQRLLFDDTFADRKRGDVLWLNSNGDVVGDSTSSVPRKANFRDTGVFQTHLHNPNTALLVGPPFKARLGDLDWCISFSRRITDPNGNFAGIAAGALRLGYVTDLFKRLDIGANSSVNLFNVEGQLLARQPMGPSAPSVGSQYAGKPNFQRILGQQSGSFVAASAGDNSEHMYTFARVGDLPLIVLVVHATDEVFASWRRTALLVSVATGLLCAGIIWLTWLLGRELHRRYQAEQRLASLAATDSLTGLANRRHLDQMLRHEWARAQRTRQPLTVLMVDVDHFKAFNQRHGHAGGDHALREVAKAIEACIRRPADLAARYGGEEFQVVLPETDAQGARLLAERICRSVERLAPFGNDTQPVTVSIGIGSFNANTQQGLAAMLGGADEALYRAKAKGRNRVEGPVT